MLTTRFSMKKWVLGAAAAAAAGAALFLLWQMGRPPALEPPPETLYHLRHEVAICKVEEGGFYAIAFPINEETGEPYNRWDEYAIHQEGVQGLQMYTTSGGLIDMTEIRPGDIVVVNTDNTTVQAIFPNCYTGPYYLTYEDP